MHVPAGLEDRQHCELLTYLPVDWEPGDVTMWWPAALLRLLGQFVHEHQTWLDVGHTVTLSEPGAVYAPGTNISAVLLRAPTVESFQQLMIDGTSCRFLWAFPITEAECDFALEQGPEALLSIIETQAPSHMIDPGRACLLRGRRP